MTEVKIEPCVKCGSDYYRLKYHTKNTYLSVLHYSQYDDPFNLVEDNILKTEALQVKCNRCGYSYFTKTLGDQNA